MLYDDVIEACILIYIIHGDNWRSGAEKAVRDHVEKLLSAYDGKLLMCHILTVQALKS